MIRATLRGAALAAALALVPALASAQPNITGITPSIGPSNTGATITVSGTGFGALDDRVYFPGTSNWVNPTAAGSGWVTARVPRTWSGNVQVQSHGTGALSNGYNHEITFTYTGRKWPAATFSWALNDQGAPGCVLADVQGQLILGFDTWACASGVSHSYSGTTATTGANHSDGLNIQWWSNSGWSDPSIIAVTTTRYNAATGDILEFDITYNSQNFTWSTTSDNTTMHVQNIGVHEEGHGIGLGDMYGAADFDKTMYGYSSEGQVTHCTLEPYDVLGAEWIYPHGLRANLTDGTPAGWYGPIVPRMANDASGASAPLPAILTGNAICYLNEAMANSGSDCAAPWSNNTIFVDDGQVWDTWWVGIWGAGETSGDWRNLDQYIRGGRHALRVDYDTNHDVVESNESDNTYEQQFVWSPMTLAHRTPETRAMPPQRGDFAALNCDGFKFTGSWWGCFAILPSQANDDYDIQLFHDYVNSTTGFSTALKSSMSGSGITDFVLWNGNVVGTGFAGYAGVSLWNAGSGYSYDISASRQVATLHPPNDYGTSLSYPDSILGGQAALVYEVHLDSTNRSYHFLLDNTSGSADLNIALYSASGDYFAKGDYVVASQGVAAGGDESFDYQPSVAGFYGLVVWKRGSADGPLENHYTLTIGPTRGDLDAQEVKGGWDWPVVPRSDNTATADNAHITPTLPGNDNPTYLNWSIWLTSPNPLPTWEGRLYIDDLEYWYFSYGGQGSFWLAALNLGQYVRGGRHTLTSMADYGGTVAESDETNNTWSGQWVWSPLALSKNTPVVRSVPPLTGPFALPNADGMQYAHPATYAWVVAEAPTHAGDDYDLGVYSDYSGSTAGYSTVLAGSGWTSNSTDFVVGHYQGTPTTVYPAVTRWSTAGGGNSFAIDQSDDVGRFGNSGPTGEILFKSQTMAANRLADVYEGYFVVGLTYHILLLRNSGSSDLLFEVFDRTPGGMYGRSWYMGISTPISASRDTLAFTPDSTGWYPIVVFRPNGTDLTPVNYDLGWNTRSTVDVPREAPPTALAFSGALPNPVTDRARLEFALPQAGPVRLALYDLGGRRVRLLADGVYGAGRHGVTWDGTNEIGTRLGAGLYWARFEACGRVMTRRVTLLR